jgi:hypothetical protein
VMIEMSNNPSKKENLWIESVVKKNGMHSILSLPFFLVRLTYIALPLNTVFGSHESCVYCTQKLDKIGLKNSVP